MLLARRIAEGVTIGDWKVHKPRRVLYVDGEMPFDGIRERDAVLSSKRKRTFLFAARSLVSSHRQSFEPDKSNRASRALGKMPA